MRARGGENMSAAIVLQKKIEKLNQKEIKLVSKYINGLIDSKNETKIIKKINLKAYQNPKKRKKPFDADAYVKEIRNEWE